jgi:hypothetical protein
MLTRQDPVKNLVATHWLLFFFLLKRRYFDFFFKKIDSDDLVTLLKLKTWVLDRVGYQIRSKIYDNYSYHSFKMFFFFLVVPFGICVRKNNIYFYNHRYLVYDMNHDMKNICCRKMHDYATNRSIDRSGLGTLGWGFLKLYPLSFEILSFFFFLLYWFMVR